MKKQKPNSENKNMIKPPARLKTIGAAAAAVIAILIILYLVFGSVITSKYRQSQLKKMNILLITLDTLRADFLSCYKQGNAQTPNLDRLASQGTLFERCISQTPLTLPAHVTILSGTYPLYHQVRDNGGFQVPGQLEFVSEALHDSGYNTSAFIGAYVLHSKWGVNQGFTEFSDDFDLDKYYTTTSEMEKKAEEVLANAETWLKTHGHEQKFFTWIHLYDPHIPYAPPPPFDKKYPDTPYRGEVEYVDDQLGKFFRFLKEEGFEENTLIVVTGDHGEGLWNHNEDTHGVFVYDTTVWVPLIIKAPFKFPVDRVSDLVEHVDIAPTLLQAAGVTAPASYQGESLLDTLLNKGNKKKHTAYTESFYARLHRGWAPLQALFSEEWKYILAPNDELYQVPQDPEEKNNLSIKKSFIKKKFRDKLERFAADKSKNAISPQQLEKRDKADLKILASLGYLTSFSNTTDKGSLPDPKDKIHLMNDYAAAIRLTNTGKLDEAILLLRQLAVNDPNNADVFLELGMAYTKKQMYAEAVEYYRECLKRKPDYNTAVINLLQSLVAMKEFDMAITEARGFLELFPEDYALLNELASAYYYKGEYPQALEYLKKSITIEPENSQAFLTMGEVYLKMKNVAEAESVINKALTIYPRLENGYYTLAQVMEAKRDLNGAVEYYKKELDNSPDNFFAAFGAGEALKNNGAYNQAIPFFKKAIDIQPGFRPSYLMIANYYVETGNQLQDAVELCNTVIDMQPPDESTIYGYYLLTQAYNKMGDPAKARFYSAEGEKLMKKLK